MTDDSPGVGEPKTEIATVGPVESADGRPLATPPEGPATPSPPADTRPALADVVLVLAVYFLPLSCGAIQGWFHPPQPLPLVWSESALAVQAAGSVALGLYLVVRSGRSPAVFGLTRPRKSDLALGGALWVVMHFTLWLYERYGPATLFGGVYRPPELFWHAPKSVTDYTLVVIAACLNGLGEEVVVRGFFQTRLEHLTRSPVGAVLITTLLFTAYHAYYGPTGMVYVFLIGLLFGVCFRMTRRLWAVAVAHVLQDLIPMTQLGT